MLTPKKRILENVTSLFILQGANYFLPLITFPYLVRVLGPGNFGLLVFAQAFIQYFVLLTDYGFNFSATQEIAIHQQDPGKVSQIFSSVMTIKLLLMLAGLIFITVLVLTIPKFRMDGLVYFVTFLLVLGNVLFPIWFFQGMEQMKYITILNLISKALSTGAIFIFVRHQSDYVLAAIIQSISPVIAGLISLPVVFKILRAPLRLPSGHELWKSLTGGWHIFISTASINFYTTTNLFILGLFTNNATVGYFSGADKIVKAVQNLLNPINQSFYPVVSATAQESKQKALEIIKKVKWIIVPVFLLAFGVLLIFADKIIKTLLGPGFDDAVPLLRIMSPIPLVWALATSYATLYMLGFGFRRDWSRLILSATVINYIILIPVGLTTTLPIALASASVLVEVYILGSSYLFFRKTSRII